MSAARRAALAVGLAAGLGSGCSAGGPGENSAGAAVPAEPRRLAVRVLAVHPHDRAAWTQGLIWHDGALYESVGLFGRSALRRVELESGTVTAEAPLDRDLFAEGLERVGDELLQLTWHAGRLLRYDLASLELRGESRYEGQGWGLCALGDELVRSAGSTRLFLHRPQDFELVRTIDVTRSGAPQGQLNELECVDGWIYANVWQSEEIVRIDPADGRVEAVIDAGGLLTTEEREWTDVLNGIAYYPPNRSFLLTGKYWPKLFEVQFVE